MKSGGINGGRLHPDRGAVMDDEERTITIMFNPATESRSEIIQRFRKELDQHIGKRRAPQRTLAERAQRRREIAEACAKGEETREQIAERFGVSLRTVSDLSRWNLREADH